MTEIAIRKNSESTRYEDQYQLLIYLNDKLVAKIDCDSVQDASNKIFIIYGSQ